MSLAVLLQLQIKYSSSTEATALHAILISGNNLQRLQKQFSLINYFISAFHSSIPFGP